jgi:hypothetical protein
VEEGNLAKGASPRVAESNGAYSHENKEFVREAHEIIGYQALNKVDEAYLAA